MITNNEIDFAPRLPDNYPVASEKYILGVGIDFVSRVEAIEKIQQFVRERPYKFHQVVTAYSEFLVRASGDEEFRDIMNRSDLVVPDGGSLLAAQKFSEKPGVINGLRVGLELFKGRLGETVTGVWLFEQITKLAVKRKWKIFLLGGWGGVASRTANKLEKSYPGIQVDFDQGEDLVGTDEATNALVIEKINRFAPDVLFVSYNPIKQEKWIDKNRGFLKNTKVAIGVGGTFAEYLGEFKPAPEWFVRHNLKWAWRLWVEPRRVRRIFNAVVVFPLLVARSLLGVNPQEPKN